VVRILAVADEVSSLAYSGGLAGMEPDLLIACGDLPFDYLEYLITTISKPLLYVPGNHDPAISSVNGTPITTLPTRLPTTTSNGCGPEGCTNIDGRIVDVAGLRIAGLGGSHRYKNGPNQYTQAEMTRRCRRLARRSLFRHPRRARRADIIVTHAPPSGVGDDDDLAHQGFEGFHRMLAVMTPEFLVHGHIHGYGTRARDHRVGQTRIVNAVGYRLLEIDS
jgi:hypothetical protein